MTNPSRSASNGREAASGLSLRDVESAPAWLNPANAIDVIAASAPPASVIEGMEAKGIQITHVYGLTEVYGPSVVCEWHEEWNGLPMEEQARLKSRQGVRYPVQEGLMVAAAETLEPVPRDGATMGEVFMRGNIVMKGYLKNPAATDEAFRGGWFHTGDLGVWHEDGYVELKDRSKDIIISGGENISTIEVEGVLYGHPAVLDAAVVARPATSLSRKTSASASSSRALITRVNPDCLGASARLLASRSRLENSRCGLRQ